MKNLLRRLAVSELTQEYVMEYERENAQEELERADDVWERKVEYLAGRVPELKESLEDLSNDVRTQAMRGGYEAGMRMGARLIYELLVVEGGRFG